MLDPGCEGLQLFFVHGQVVAHDAQVSLVVDVTDRDGELFGFRNCFRADLSIAVEVTTARPAKARALLYRAPSGSLSVWPLRRDGGGAEITDVGVAPGPSVTLQIDADADVSVALSSMEATRRKLEIEQDEEQELQDDDPPGRQRSRVHVR